jgi:beta-glucosidase
MSWPRTLGQVPVFFGERPSGRPFNAADHYTSKYLDTPNEPLYPFGFGLNYGRFQFADLRVTPAVVGESDTIEAVVRVTNQGRREAEETVFLFTHDRFACVARPLLELKGFAKISLRPGETGTVAIKVPASDLRFLGLDLKPVFEPGEVEILVGPSADRSQLQMASIQLRD